MENIAVSCIGQSEAGASRRVHGHVISGDYEVVSGKRGRVGIIAGRNGHGVGTQSERCNVKFGKRGIFIKYN